MNKLRNKLNLKVLHILPILIIVGLLIPQPTHAGLGSWLVDSVGNTVLDALLFIPGWAINEIVLKIANFITWLAGTSLNLVVDYTVVNMSQNLEASGAITDTWKVVRDLANIGFIFILLYAAIRTILGVGDNNQRLIVSMVVVAVLVNFSLFFTKFIIDVSNIVAILFYDALAPGSLMGTAGIKGSGGISNSITGLLKLQTLMQVDDLTNTFNGTQTIIVGVMGTIMSLIAAFVLFAVTLLFVIRFVVLIFVLILSPLMFVSMVLPKTQEYATQWWDALIGQSIFAPIYFLMTFIVIKVGTALFSSNLPLSNTFLGVVNDDGTVKAGDATLFMNFVIIIALLIASLTISKQWASKGGGQMGKIVSGATGFAGGVTLGIAGRVGRNTFGRFGATVGDSDRLKEAAAKGSITARMALTAGRGVSKASFDVRGTGVVSDAGKAQKGGFAQTLKDKAKKEKEFADSLGPSDANVTAAERKMEKAKTTYGKDSTEYLEARKEVDRLKGIDEKEAIKRYKEENRRADGLMMSDNEAKEIINKNRDDYIKKSLKDIRKEERVVAMENSPTFKAAGAIQKGAERAGGAIEDLAQKITQAGEQIAANAQNGGSIKRIAGKIVGGAVRDVGATVDVVGGAVSATPRMVMAKNRVAIAEVRKGKKPVKDRLEEILKEEGEVTGAQADGGTPPAPATGGTPT